MIGGEQRTASLKRRSRTSSFYKRFGSAATPDGYDAANLAEDVHQLGMQLRLERPYLAGHDIGGTVAYAFVRLYPAQVRGVMILDVPLPSIIEFEG